MIELLRRGPRRAGELAAALSVRPPALSRHLKVLRASGLVTEAHPEEDARARVFTLRQAPFDELRAWIEDVEAFWAGQLQAFRRRGGLWWGDLLTSLREHVAARAPSH